MNDLMEAVKRIIMQGGPTRVVINEDGEAMSFMRAKSMHDISSDIIFIRDDGWSLGAPKRFANVAEKTWPERWKGVLLRPLTTPISYHEYLRVKEIVGEKE